MKSSLTVDTQRWSLKEEIDIDVVSGIVSTTSNDPASYGYYSENRL